MWSSDEDGHVHQQQQLHRAAKAYEAELQLRYLSPGAFTILPPDVQGAPPDSPPVINNYRLTPTARRNRNAAFSIIAESSSNPGSRSPSPTGRVSPFRGRGFNPIGSRHASPVPSPRHEDSRGPSFHYQQREDATSTKRSKIPTLSRRGSNADLYSEKQISGLPPRVLKTRTNLSRQYSKSMTNVSPKQLNQKATPNNLSKPSKPTAFQKLSPIAGSSPESGRIRPSPSKIPRSRSQPPAVRSSGTTSGSRSKSSSTNVSRDSSPIKIPTKNNYKNVKAKVNSFNTVKPKVPAKPQVPMPKLERKDSKISSKPSYSDNNSSNSPSKGRTKGGVKNNPVSKKIEPSQINVNEIENDALSSQDSSPKKTNSGSDVFTPSSTVVSSTTTTAIKPLNIDTKMGVNVNDNDKGDMTNYLSDVRTLSATSVSTALNRMNDTVLDTKTLMKETNRSSRIPPTVVSSTYTTENSPANSDGTNHRTPPRETKSNPSPFGINNNIEEVNVKSDTNRRTNSISPHHSVVGINVLPKSAANDTIKEERTVVATDVQPIRIVVKEKPSNPEVQSGNVRLSVSAANGIGERPGLPPPQSPQEETTTAANEPPKGICGRLFGRCRKQTKEQKSKGSRKAKKKRWWFSKKEDSEVPANEEKVKWWQKLTCCKRKKVGDVERENGSQRKNSWAERRDSFIAEPPKLSSKDKCKNFLRTICCLNFCSKKRKKEEEDAIKRRESLMSKKKSLTPLATVVEEPQTTKLDAGLVEHTSVMKAAIPVLPVPLAWLCLILNVFIPGFGTILSGFFCLCIGKPRFSQKDGPKPRIGACIIDFFIGCGQLFTVLFCLVGWGWSIWWGIIMLKLARKYRKIRRAERAMEEDAQNAATVNHLDVERGV